MKLLPKFKPYYAIIKIDGPIDRGRKHNYRCWYPDRSKATIKECVAVVQLNKYAAGGFFNEAGKYVFVMWQEGWKMHYALYKETRSEE